MSGIGLRGIPQRVASRLKAWVNPTGRPNARAGAFRSPRLSRRGLLFGVFGLAVAAGQYVPDQPNALFHNRGDGTFLDVSQPTGSDHTGCARGLAVADIDGDGFLDLLVANLDQPPALLKNSGNDNRWLQVRLVGLQSNRDGMGARLTLTAGGSRQIREVQSGTSFLSQHSLVAHFGLGRHQRVDELKIRWPSGIVQTLTDLPANRMITVTEAV